MEDRGLEKGGIYRHFSTKEELAAEAFDYAWQAATDGLMRDLDSIPNSVNKLKRFMSNFVEWRSSVPGGGPPLNTAIGAGDGNPLLRQRARKALHKLHVLLSANARTRNTQEESGNRVSHNKW